MDLVNRLLDSATIIDNKIIKVDHLINHNIDVKLLDLVARDMAKELVDLNIDKIVTIETGGISIATLLATHLGYIDVVYAKKGLNKLSSGECYESVVSSFTRGKEFVLTVDKRFLNENDNVVFVDDFLATGSAFYAIKDICDKANCNIIKSLYIFNKTFQNDIVDDVYSVVNVKEFSDNKIVLDKK